MAQRKSNKTAHVLNLLQGSEEAKAGEDGELKEKKEAKADAPAGIPVVDTTTKDPVSDLIRDKLESTFEDLDPAEEAEFDPELPKEEPEPAPEFDPELPKEEPEPKPEFDPGLPKEEPEPAPEFDAGLPPRTPPAPAAKKEADIPAVHTIIQSPSEYLFPGVEDGLEAFISLNVMQRIVTDQIEYFMDEFEMCKCPRCVADTVTYALDNLPPLYIVTNPGSVDPLISFYANKYVSQITVAVTQACVVVKEKPRH